MSMVPHSFDVLVLQDELLAALKQSPQTSQLVGLRAQQIVQSILEKPMIVRLEGEVRELRAKLQQEKELKRTIRSTSKKQCRQVEEEFSEKKQMVQRLSEQIEGYLASIDALQNENQELQRQLEQHQEKVGEMERELEDVRGENERLGGELQELARLREELVREVQGRDGRLAQLQEEQARMSSEHRTVVNQLEVEIIRNKEQSTKQLQAQVKALHESQHSGEVALQEKDRTIELLKEERFTLKNEINGLKIDVQQMDKQLALVREEGVRLSVERDKAKESLKTNKHIFDKERKLVNARLYELSVTYKAHQKLKANTMVICKAMVKLRKEYSQLSVWIGEQLGVLKSEGQEKTRAMLDEVGWQVEREVGVLRDKLQSRGEEARGARSESKQRQQALERSERQLAANAKEVSELRGEVRVRRREEERLRRQLKSSYEQSEAKLLAMEKKYVQLLGKGGY